MSLWLKLPRLDLDDNLYVDVDALTAIAHIPEPDDGRPGCILYLAGGQQLAAAVPPHVILPYLKSARVIEISPNEPAEVSGA